MNKLTFQPPPPEKQNISCRAFFENEEERLGASNVCDVRERRPGWCPSEDKAECLQTCCWADDSNYKTLSNTFKLTHEWPQLTNCHSWRASEFMDGLTRCIKAPNTSQSACIAGNTKHENLAFPLCKDLCCLPVREHCGNFHPNPNPPLCTTGKGQKIPRRGQWIANAVNDIGADGRKFLQTVRTWGTCSDPTKTTRESCIPNTWEDGTCSDPTKTTRESCIPNTWENNNVEENCTGENIWLPYKGGCLYKTGRWVTDRNTYNSQKGKTGVEGEYTYIKDGEHRMDGGGLAFTHEVVPLGERPLDYCCTPTRSSNNRTRNITAHFPVKSCALFNCGGLKGFLKKRNTWTDGGVCLDLDKKWCTKDTSEESCVNTWGTCSDSTKTTKEDCLKDVTWDLEQKGTFIEGMWNNGSETCTSTIDGTSGVCTVEDCCEYKKCHELATIYDCPDGHVLRSTKDDKKSDNRNLHAVSTLYEDTVKACAITEGDHQAVCTKPSNYSSTTRPDFTKHCCIEPKSPPVQLQSIDFSCGAVFNSDETACLNIDNEDWHGYPKTSDRLKDNVFFGPYMYFSRTKGGNTLSNISTAFWQSESILREPSIHAGWHGNNPNTNYNWVPSANRDKTCVDEFRQPRRCTIRDCCRPSHAGTCSNGVPALRDKEKAEKEWWRFPCSRDMIDGEDVNCFTHAGLAERMIGLKKPDCAQTRQHVQKRSISPVVRVG